MIYIGARRVARYNYRARSFLFTLEVVLFFTRYPATSTFMAGSRAPDCPYPVHRVAKQREFISAGIINKAKYRATGHPANQPLGLLNKLGALSRARSWGIGVLCWKEYYLQAPRQVVEPSRFLGFESYSLQTAREGTSRPRIEVESDPAEPPTALAGCYYAGSTSRTPVSVLKPSNALRFGVFQKATAGFFLFRDLVP
ncbi:hypothetical protein DFH06DRAFT_1150404, partial [Mycena polygramma]